MESIAESIARARADGHLPAGLGMVRTATANEAEREERARVELELDIAAARRRAEYFAALAEGREPPREAAVELLPAPLATADGLPECAACRGIRMVRRDVPVSDPDFGKILPCPACLARPDIAPQLAARTAQAVGLADEQTRLTFATFATAADSREAFEAAEAWASNPTTWLVIHGEPGCGKTHLACAAVNLLVGTGRRVRFWYAPDLTRAAKRAIGEGNGAEDYLLRELIDLPILVIDDLGAARATDYVLSEVLEPLIDARYRAKRPTLITMISSPAQARGGSIGESICRRLMDPRVCRIVENRAPQWGA